MVAEDLDQFRPDPARVPDLDGKRDFFVRPAGEKGVEDFEEVVERRERPPVEVAELEKSGRQLVAEREDRLDEAVDLFLAVAKLLGVGDDLRNLEHEPEPIGRPIAPAFDHSLRRDPVKGAIDLDDREPVGVPVQVLAAGHPFGIKGAFPVGIAPAAATDPDRVVCRFLAHASSISHASPSGRGKRSGPRSEVGDPDLARLQA